MFWYRPGNHITFARINERPLEPLNQLIFGINFFCHFIPGLITLCHED